MHVQVDTEGLRADGAGLSATASPSGGAPRCAAAAADPVSVSVASTLTQWSNALWTLMEHAGRQREAGGMSLSATASHLGAIDDANAANIGNSLIGDASQTPLPAAPTPNADASIPVPTLPAMPDMPAPPPLTGEQVSAMVHAGPGPDRLRAFAQQWRDTLAPHIMSTADETRRYGHSVECNWDDGDPAAARNVNEHADWLESALHQHAMRLADSADQAATHVESVIQDTPRPEEFQDIHNRITVAEANYRASGGRNRGQLVALNGELGQMQASAAAGYQTYAAAAPVTATGGAQPPPPAPPIVRGGPAQTMNPQINHPNPANHDGDRGQGDKHGKDVAGDTLEPSKADSGPPIGPSGTPPVAAAQPPGLDPTTPGVAANIAGTIMGAGVGTASQLANSLHGMGSGGSPLSALSGLSSIPGLGGMPQTGMPQMPSGMGDGAPDGTPDLGAGPDFGSDGTTPAGGDGGGGGGAPVSSSSPAVSAAPTGAGPVVRTPSTGSPAPSTPSGGMGGPAMYPPMMGGPGHGNDEGNKSKDKRRVVMRPVPNTEPVFGEVERKRSTRRAKKEEQS
jgi:hypothetical protein